MSDWNPYHTFSQTVGPPTVNNSGYYPTALHTPDENSLAFFNEAQFISDMVAASGNVQKIEIVTGTLEDIAEAAARFDAMVEEEDAVADDADGTNVSHAEGSRQRQTESMEPDVDMASPTVITNPAEETVLGWNGIKYLPEFLEPWKDIPGRPDLRTICAQYPNHLFGKWLDAFIQWKWSDAAITNEVSEHTKRRWISLKFCTLPKNLLMKRLERRWMELGPEGMIRLDSAAKIYNAHKTGNSKQLLVRDPDRYAKALKAKEDVKEANRAKRQKKAALAAGDSSEMEPIADSNSE